MRNDPRPDAPLAHLTVLVAEDEFLLALDFEAMLEHLGARVLGPAATTEEALRLLDAELPDVALLDVNLKDGWVTPVAELLRSRGIPYALTSAYSAADLVGIEALSTVPNLGKLIRERDLIAALDLASRR